MTAPYAKYVIDKIRHNKKSITLVADETLGGKE